MLQSCLALRKRLNYDLFSFDVLKSRLKTRGLHNDIYILYEKTKTPLSVLPALAQIGVESSKARRLASVQLLNYYDQVEEGRVNVDVILHIEPTCTSIALHKFSYNNP